MWKETLWSVFIDIIEESKFTTYNINKSLRRNTPKPPQDRVEVYFSLQIKIHEQSPYFPRIIKHLSVGSDNNRSDNTRRRFK